jgi:hypothetical protein
MLKIIARHAGKLAVAAALVACSSPNESTVDSGIDSGTKPSAGETGNTSAGTTAKAEFVTTPCTEPGSICTTYKVPATFSGTPARLFVGFYSKLPPAGPPDVFGSQVDTGIPVEAGKSITLKQTGITGVTGQDLWVYTVLYMPGGGQFQPVKDVDYVSSSPKATKFDDKAQNIDCGDFVIAQ